MIHGLIERQLRKAAGDTDKLIELVAAAYEEYDRALKRRDHAMRLMSAELTEANAAIRHEGERRMAENQKRFELAVEAANDGIWDWNVWEDRLWLSHRAKTMLGHAQDSMEKCGIEDWYALAVPADRDAARAFIRKCLDKREQQVATLRFEYASGGARHIMCRASVVLDEAGRVARIVGIHTDITALVLMNDELKRTKTLAEAANAAKSDFLANMSHELRTPLNSVLGMTRLLMESGLTDGQKELADIVRRSSTNLLDIVNDILDLSKIEAGEVELEKVGFDLVYTFDSVLTALEQLARDKRLPVKGVFDRGAFPYVTGDPLRMTRVLTNLISNAIKYTDEGHVEFRAFCRNLDDGNVEIRCEIQDSGIGIAMDKVDKIFDKFVQADTSTTRRFGGTGLGLAITRELIELMGGQIGVDSVLGQGSTFWCTVPFPVAESLTALRSSERRASRQKGDTPAEQARILIAEDHPLNQIFISKLMEKFGVGYYEIADNGREALEKCTRGGWHVVLMDCHMPEINGYDTTKAVRHHEKDTGLHVPIVAMTANAMVGEKEKCLRSGMDDYLSKPVDSDELKDVLGRWLDFSETAPAAQGMKGTAGSEQAVDPKYLRNFSDGDKDMERELVQVFTDQSDKNMNVLAESFRTGDEKSWRETAHMLKGGSSGIGAARMSVLCDRMQNFTGTAKDLAALYENLLAEYERVKDYFRKEDLLG
jgi:PAS domain S-box-containing protein